MTLREETSTATPATTNTLSLRSGRWVGALLATRPGECFLPLRSIAAATHPTDAPVAPAASGDDFACVASALLSALDAGGDASLFLMDGGVLYALDPRTQDLIAAGVDVSLCAMDAEAHGVDPHEVTRRGIVLGSQRDHARLVRDCDPFLCFT